jgi:hypothetical protein
VNADGDLTARLGALREVLHNEIAASALLLGARVDSVDAERGILLAGLNERTQTIHDELDGQLGHLQRQVDQRFEASKETLVALKVMLDERYATQTKALDAAFKAAEQAVAVALANAEKATVKAETAADKRFDAVNEFRQTLTDQASTFLPRTEYDAARTALSDRIAFNADRVGALELRLTSRLDRGEGSDAGTAAFRTERRLDVGQLLQVLVALIAVAAVVVAVLKG